MYKREYTYVARHWHQGQEIRFPVPAEYQGKLGLEAVELKSFRFGECNQPVAVIFNSIGKHWAFTRCITPDVISANFSGLTPSQNTFSKHLTCKAWLRGSRAPLHRLPNQNVNASTAFHPLINTALQ